MHSYCFSSRMLSSRFLSTLSSCLASLSGDTRVILELSHDRMMAVAQLPDSVLLRSIVYPSIKYYVLAGQE
eukprot:m.914634 g.914634  ORF g.914634 m.914634 type:complete len:71 (-) comp60142_c0_seq8:4811-5023(-)